MNVQVWVCYLNHLLAMLGCSFNTLHPNLIKSSMNSLQVHDSPCTDRWSIAPRVCCQSDCPSVKRQKGTILVWNVLVPPRALSGLAGFGMAQRTKTSCRYILTRDLFISVPSARLPLFFSSCVTLDFSGNSRDDLTGFSKLLLCVITQMMKINNIHKLCTWYVENGYLIMVLWDRI